MINNKLEKWPLNKLGVFFYVFFGTLVYIETIGKRYYVLVKINALY